MDQGSAEAVSKAAAPTVLSMDEYVKVGAGDARRSTLLWSGALACLPGCTAPCICEHPPSLLRRRSATFRHLIPGIEPAAHLREPARDARICANIDKLRSCLMATRCLRNDLQLGRKRAPNFSSHLREQIYPLFENYEKIKVWC